MDIKELGSFNVSFDCEYRALINDFVDTSIVELSFQAKELIRDPGKYQLVLIVNQLPNIK